MTTNTEPAANANLTAGSTTTLKGTNGPPTSIDIDVLGMPTQSTAIIGGAPGNWEQALALPNVPNVDIVVTVHAQGSKEASRTFHLV